MSASEKEQIEALQKWWKENGSSIITGLLLGVAILLGGKAWFGYQETQTVNASNIYATMMIASQASKQEEVRARANKLISDYTDTTYAPLASLLLAKYAVQDGELAAAQAQLQWALDHADSPEIKHEARMRLLQVMIAQQQYAPAAQLLSSVTDAGPYDFLYAELEGDLAVAEGEPEKAASAYKKALDSIPAQAPNRAYLVAKYEDIRGAGTADQ
ncbi:MAG: tetratricopeptide repeat protein [Gammaproteobacteria bacterium]|nr:MAG: tetratricopeptide repeat protein [Gammaproteobacteria bacterium]